MELINNNILCDLVNETTELLNNSQDLFCNIKWNDGESNLDFEYSKIVCNICEKAWNNIKNKDVLLNNINIKCSPPDINIIFQINDITINKKIELKYSKIKKIPGSTIKNLDINQPLIYCLKPKNINGKYIFKCSQYIDAMGESNIDLFQDRTPRPYINFNKMNDRINEYKEHNKNYWIEHYANCSLERLNNNCKYSWQDDLIKNIKDKIISEFIEKTSIKEFEHLKTIKNIENLSLV